MKQSEIDREPEAQKAADKEWHKLDNMPHPDGKGKGVWDYKTVIEYDDLVAQAQASGETIHLGRVGELCYQKNSELPDGDPLKVFKGRHVFLGDQVFTQDFEYAVFEELGSAPPTMEASRCLDAFSCMPGYMQSTDDGYAAYCQCFLGGGRGKGIRTFVDIPRHRWPKEWIGKYKRPVIQLILDLYGHPDAGGYWEQHCEEQIMECGWERIDDWRSVFWHPGYRALLIVYVDDFKLAARIEHTKQIWAELRKRIIMDGASESERFLGCYQREFTAKISDASLPRPHYQGAKKNRD